ncbi:hypothetical protein STENM327S_02934 [Streptomyces tendae]
MGVGRRARRRGASGPLSRLPRGPAGGRRRRAGAPAPVGAPVRPRRSAHGWRGGPVSGGRRAARRRLGASGALPPHTWLTPDARVRRGAAVAAVGGGGRGAGAAAATAAGDPHADAVLVAEAGAPGGTAVIPAPPYRPGVPVAGRVHRSAGAIGHPLDTVGTRALRAAPSGRAPGAAPRPPSPGPWRAPARLARARPGTPQRAAGVPAAHPRRHDLPGRRSGRQHADRTHRAFVAATSPTCTSSARASATSRRTP